MDKINSIMDINKLREDIALQFMDEDQAGVKIENDFRSLETYDSLTGMAILTIIQDEYGVEIPVEEYRKLSSVRALFDYIQSKKNE